MKDSHPVHQETAENAGVIALVVSLAACVLFAVVIIVLGFKVHRRDAQLADTQKQLVQAKSDGAKAKAELDKANAAGADLKAQLEKEKSVSVDLQSQVDQGKSALADLQAQMDKARAQTTELQAQLDKSKAQSTDLQNQLTQAAAGSTQLLTQLDQAKIQSMDMQQRLQKAEADIAQLQPMLLKERHMPVATTFEKEHWGRGVTLHLNNLNEQPLSVNISIVSQGASRSQSNVIGAAGALSLEKLSNGDTVDIASDGYEAVHLTVQ